MVDLTTERRVATKLMESLVSCTEDERDEVLYYLLARCEECGRGVGICGARVLVAGLRLVVSCMEEGQGAVLPAGQV